MSNNSTGLNGRVTAANARGDHTRDRLLDALEEIAADEGLAALTHRAIAKRAQLHAALIHYHFGTVERLIEEALARRAQRLTRTQLAALSALFARGRWTVEDVVGALWQPFAMLTAPREGAWHNYLCLVARLASDAHGAALVGRHFQDVAHAALDALRAVLPTASSESLAAGLRFVRTLFEQEALVRCARGQRVVPVEDAHLVTFAAAGLRALAVEAPAIAMPLRAQA